MEDGIFPKLKFVNFYMQTAHLCAELSYAKRLQVGAAIVKDDRIISYGYNGTPSNYDNTCEDEEGKTKKEVLHAEANALMKAAQVVNLLKVQVYILLMHPVWIVQR